MDATATLPEKETLETRVGPLARVYPQFKPESLQQADERNVERVTNPVIRNLYGWTANVAVYRVEKNPDSGQDEAFLYFGGRDAFNAVIGKNLAKATSQLISKGNYTPKREEVDIDAVVKSSLRIKISDLNLLGDEDEYGYFEIDTSDVTGKKLNAAQRAFSEKVYGSLEEKTDEATKDKYTDFGRTMKMLSDAGIVTTKIYALKSGYVESNVSEEEPVLARACWLYYFSNYSNFLANLRLVDGSNGSLRGVRVAGGDAPKASMETAEKKPVVPSYDDALKVVSEQPVRTEKQAAALLERANQFYQSRAK